MFSQTGIPQKMTAQTAWLKSRYRMTGWTVCIMQANSPEQPLLARYKHAPVAPASYSQKWLTDMTSNEKSFVPYIVNTNYSRQVTTTTQFSITGLHALLTVQKFLAASDKDNQRLQTLTLFSLIGRLTGNRRLGRQCFGSFQGPLHTLNQMVNHLVMVSC